MNLKMISTFFALILVTVISKQAMAISFQVIGPCSDTPVSEGNYQVNDLKTSVGKISLLIFDLKKIDYKGSESGFTSILNTPTGDASLEVISDTKMRAYGWCYSLNGTIPNVVAGDLKFNSDDDKLIWFYGYSTYDKGVWTDYCQPSYSIKAAQFCSK